MSDECRGCEIHEKYHDATTINCAYKQDKVDHLCPCKTCIVKVNCSQTCEEADKLLYNNNKQKYIDKRIETKYARAQM